MARRAGSADLPLHHGRVPAWLGQRMARLGAVMTEAIVHHYGRDEFLRRLAHPFWFQSFGAVMGMDWHSSGITTSVLGALKRGLGAAVRASSASMSAAAAAAHSRARPDELVGDRRARRLRRRGAGPGQPAGRQGRQRRGAGRLRPLPARLRRHRRRQLGRGAAGHERREPAGAPLPLAVRRAESFVDGRTPRSRAQARRRDRQPHRPPRRGLAARPARAAARASGPTGSCARSRRLAETSPATARSSRCCRIW